MEIWMEWNWHIWMRWLPRLIPHALGKRVRIVRRWFPPQLLARGALHTPYHKYNYVGDLANFLHVYRSTDWTETVSLAITMNSMAILPRYKIYMRLDFTASLSDKWFYITNNIGVFGLHSRAVHVRGKAKHSLSEIVSRRFRAYHTRMTSLFFFFFCQNRWVCMTLPLFMAGISTFYVDHKFFIQTTNPYAHRTHHTRQMCLCPVILMSNPYAF